MYLNKIILSVFVFLFLTIAVNGQEQLGDILSCYNSNGASCGAIVKLSDNGTRIVYSDVGHLNHTKIDIGFKIIVQDFYNEEWTTNDELQFGTKDVFYVALDVSGDGNTIASSYYEVEDEEDTIDLAQLTILDYSNNSWSQDISNYQPSRNSTNPDIDIQLDSSGLKMIIGSAGCNSPFNDIAFLTKDNQEWKSVEKSWNTGEIGSSLGMSAHNNSIISSAHRFDCNLFGKSGKAVLIDFDSKNVIHEFNGLHPEHQFGIVVAMSGDGNTIAIVAANSHHLGESYQVYAYRLIEGQWQQIGEAISGFNYHYISKFGLDLSYNGNRLAIGSINYQYTSSIPSRARLYEYKTGNWYQVQNEIVSDDNNDNHTGFSVSLSASGNILAVGEPWKIISGTPQGQVRVFEFPPFTSNTNDVDGSLSLYPNPTSGTLFIQSDNLINSIKIFDIMGQEVYSGVEKQFDLTEFPSGTYLLFYSIGGKKGWERIMKL